MQIEIEEEILNDIDRAFQDFNRVWESAPRSLTRVTEREAAEYFYRLGQRDGRSAEIKETNQNLALIVQGRGLM